MSTVRADNVAPSAGGTTRNLPRGVAAAWINLNGTGTIAIRDSQNIASVVDNGTGDYTSNLSSVMSSANFAASFGYTPASGIGVAGHARIMNISALTASSVRALTGYQDSGGSAGEDATAMNFSTFGSLA